MKKEVKYESYPISDCCGEKLNWDKKGYNTCSKCDECCDRWNKILLENSYGGSYTLGYDDRCIILRNNNTNELVTHFFREAIEAISLLNPTP